MKLKTEWLYSNDCQYTFNLTDKGYCENKDDQESECSCSYNRCYVISGIESEGFSSDSDYERLVNNCIPDGLKNDDELKSKILAVFKQFDFENLENYNYQTNRGYYGEYLSSVSLDIATQIVEELNKITLK